MVRIFFKTVYGQVCRSDWIKPTCPIPVNRFTARLLQLPHERTTTAQRSFPVLFHLHRSGAWRQCTRSVESQLDECLQLLSTIPEDKSLHRYAAEKWSIRQVLNHLSDTERALAFRALWFARGFDTSLPSYDQNIAAAGAQADAIPWSSNVEEFKRIRLATISLFRNFPAQAWMRAGIASDSRFTGRALPFIIAGHVTHHFKIVRQKYL